MDFVGSRVRSSLPGAVGCVLALCLAGCADAPDPSGSLEVLHAFAGSDGSWSRGSLVGHGRTLYGRTSLGGAHDSGTIFAIEDDGSDFRVVHSFTAGGSNGAGNQPHHNAMLVVGARLVGAALYGGNEETSAAVASVPPPPGFPKVGNGTIFSIDTRGNGYSVLLELGGTGLPALPHSPPVLASDAATLYGLTSNGGAQGTGTLYRLSATGGTAEVLHSFEKAHGEEPHGMVAFEAGGRLLLGMTRKGGTLSPGAPPGEPSGVVFRYDLDTGAYEVLHVLATGDPENGATNDHGFFTFAGGEVYATTEYGGAHDRGTVFAIDPDDGQFRIVHSFAGGTGDGAYPYGSLLEVDGWLYGTTTQGGASGDGTLFRVRAPDGPLEVVASFDRATSGAFPEDNVVRTADGTALVGLTQAGGANDPTAALYYGTVFAYRLPVD